MIRPRTVRTRQFGIPAQPTRDRDNVTRQYSRPRTQDSSHIGLRDLIAGNRRHLPIRRYIHRLHQAINRRRGSVLSALSILATVLVLYHLFPGTKAASIALPRQDIIDGYANFNAISTAADGTLSLQRGDMGVWGGSDGVEQLPIETSNVDSQLAFGPDHQLYLLSQIGNCRFFVHNPTTKSWTELAAPPQACSSGTGLTYDNANAMYYFPGGGASTFYRYDIPANSWTKLEDIPGQVSGGASTVYARWNGRGYIYALRGNSSNSFWRYDILAGTWSQQASFVASNLDWGQSMTWDQGSYLYVLNNNYGDFRRYSLASNTWTNLAGQTNGGTRKNRIMHVGANIISLETKLWSTGGENGYLQQYNIAGNTWTDLADPPSGTIWDHAPAAATDGTDVYGLWGQDMHTKLYRYTIASNSWNIQHSLYSRTAITGYRWKPIFDGNHTVYYIGGYSGADKNSLMKYDLQTGGQPTQIDMYPQFGSRVGNAGVYYNNALYMIPDNGNRSFAKYDLISGDWVQLTDYPIASNNGSDLVDGGNGYLYLITGNSNQFWRFSEAGGWTQMANAPHAQNGGAGITRIGSNLYVMPGGATAYIDRYNITTNTWTSTVTMAPVGDLDFGAVLVGDGAQYLYVAASSRTHTTAKYFYRYDTAGNTWKRLANLPSDTNIYAFGFYDTNTSRVYISPSLYEPVLWYWSPTAAGYANSGDWYSKTYDLTQVQSWTSLTYTTGGTGTVQLSTRTSTDKINWEAWTPVSGNSIGSNPHRYLQIKANLAGNGSSTPTLANLSINYAQETASPSLPSQFTAVASPSDSTPLTSGQTYEYEHPRFSWTGADDGANGAGVDGYYVYYGTDSGANPVTAGTYQTSTGYVVSQAMTAGNIYYVRIVVKDKLGNTSPAATYFSYRYFYISPPGVVLNTTQSDFANGTNTSVELNTNPGSMQLKAEAGGSWSTGPQLTLPDTSSGGASAVVGDYLYVARGSSTTTFWRYDTVNQVWNTLAATPYTISSGSSMAYDGSRYLYLMRGGSGVEFMRYDTINDTWLALANLPDPARSGSDMAYVGNGRIIIMFSNTSDFYQYNVATNNYTIRTSPPVTEDAGTTGGGVWYDGNDTLYVFFGGMYWWNTNRKSFTAYSLSQDSWRYLPQPSLASYSMENNLTSDGNGHLYLFSTDAYYNTSPGTLATRYTIATGTWEPISNYKGVGGRGTVASDNQRYIYIIPSQNNSRRIYRYDTLLGRISADTPQLPSWQQVAWGDGNARAWAAGQATTAAYDGTTYAYILGRSNGGNYNQIARYHTKTGTVDYIAPAPYAGTSGSMAYMGNYLYYLPANSTANFYRYDPGMGDWTRLANAPGTVDRPGPSTLISDGTALYALRGGNNTAFYKFTPDAGSGSWSTLTAIPGSILHSAAVYDGSRYIYVIRSNNTANLYRYDTTGGSWTTLNNLPTTIQHGAAMAIENGKIYVTAGNTRTSVYVYTIGADTWTASADAPEPFRYGAMLVKIDSNQALAIAGQDNPDLWFFNFASATTAYQSLGTHISQPIQVAGIYDYAGIQAETTIPANTDVEFYTRTSNDSVTWDPWTRTTDTKLSATNSSYHIASTPRRYIQIKAVLSSLDNRFTPVVGSYALDYYYDVTPPTNPTQLDVYSDGTKTTTLATNTWYNHAQPVFDWPDPGQTGGATDGQLGSHIKGYWTYLGTDSTATPSTAGTFVTATQYQPSLTTPGTYYLRIQAQDVTGNIDPAIYDAFIYKFDNVPPDNPAFITVTPSGFTSRNNFSFVWPNGHDNDSGVDSYCYRTGATSGPFATEICQPGTTLDNLSAAYTQGTNALYLRTRDIAGNYSTGEAQVSFYYSTAAPTPPANLRAIPPVSAQNMFAFTWDLPALFAGDPDQLQYCYSINELPSAINTTCGTDRFLAPFKAATQQNTNVIYMVARDESGNVNWNNYASANFIANTVSPGIPLNLVIVDSSDRLTNRWSLTLTWDRPTFEGNGIDHYLVERSTDQHTYTTIGTTSNAAYIDLNVQADTIYYYRVRASDNVDNRSGPSGVVSQTPKGKFIEPPTIVSEPTAASSFDSATIGWVTARDSTSFVYYGTNPSTLSQSKGTLDAVSKHTVQLTGLSPSTVYYYRVQSFDLERNYSLDNSYSQIYSFRTGESAHITGVTISDIGLSTALVSWQTNVPTSAKVDYGPTTDYSFTKTDESGYSTSHILKIDGMSGGNRYHLRISATTPYGSVVTSDDYHFDTIPLPVISNVRFQPLNDQPTIAVRITWSTNVPTDSQLTYTSLGSSKKQADGTLATDHAIILTDLASNADYKINLTGRDQYGNLANADTQTWHSQVDTRPPSISKVSVNVANTGLWGNAKAQIIVSWHTDEPSSSQIQYGDGLGAKLTKSTPIDTEPTTDHVVVINGLELTHVYGIQPVSRDITGNTAYGNTLAAVTPDKQNSLLDIILSAFQKLTGKR